MPEHIDIEDLNSDNVPATYWLNVCEGLQAAKKFLSGSSSQDAFAIINQYPILGLNEMPEAITELVNSQPDSSIRLLGLSRAETLRQIQSLIKNKYPKQQAVLLKKCGILLAQERRGKLGFNLYRSILLFQEARSYCENTSEDFADCLLNEGSSRSQLTTLGFERQANTETAIELYRQARAIYAPGSNRFAVSLRNEGSARQDLANLEIDAKANLEEAINLNQQACQILAPNSIEFARNLLDEGNAYLRLGTMKVNPQANLEEAVTLYERAREIYPHDYREYGLCLINEAKARIVLATELNVNSLKNVEAVLALCTQAYGIFEPTTDTVEIANCLGYDADAHKSLAQQGVDAKTNFDDAIKRYSLARGLLTDEGELALILVKEADAHRQLSELESDSKEHLHAALELYARAKDLWPPGSENLANCLLNYATVCALLAAHETEVEALMEKALDLYDEALAIYPPDKPRYAEGLYNKGIAYRRLAHKGINAHKNLDQAIEQFEKASKTFSKGSSDLGNCLEEMANSYMDLDRLGISERSNLEEALKLYSQAKECYEPNSLKFANCIANEAIVRQSLAESSVNTQKGIEEAIKIYRQVREIFTPGSEDFAISIFSEATARGRLADLGIAPRKNAEEAIQLYHEARNNLSPSDETYSKCLINEGGALQTLADMGINAKANLGRKLKLLDEARKNFSPNSPDYANCLIGEANARARLADLGISVQVNLEETIKLSSQARNIYTPRSLAFAHSLENEGNARKELAGFGVAARSNTEEAIKHYRHAREILPQNGADFAKCLLNEGIARKQLADLSIDTRDNLEESIKLFEQARTIYPPDNIYYARSQMNEGNTRLALASLGIDTTWNLEQAVGFYRDARQRFSLNSIDAAVCFMYEGNARNQLAGLEVDEQANSEEAVKLYGLARGVFLPDSLDFARCLMLEGNARQRLANLEIEARTNLEEALRLYVEAHKTFLLLSPDVLSESPDFASCLINEGGALFNLAELGIDSEDNLRQMIRLCVEGRQLLPPETVSFAQALSNEGAARQRLASLNVDAEENWRESLNIFRRVSQMFTHFGSYLDAVSAYESLAWVEKELGHLQETENAFAKAIESLEHVRTNTLLTQDRRQWMEKHDNIFRGMVKTSLNLKHYENALEYVERARSRALLDMLYIRDFEPRNYPKEKIEAYREKRERAEVLETVMATEIREYPGANLMGSNQTDVMRREKAMLLAELRRMEEEMRQLDPDYFALAKPASFTEMKEVAAAMRRTLVIIWMEAAQTAVFFVRPDGELSCLEMPDLGLKRVIEWMIGSEEERGNTGWMIKYLKNLEVGQTQAEREASRKEWMAQIDKTTAILYDELLGEIHKQLQNWNETKVALVVGGLLGLLPLHAASWQEKDQSHYLLESLDIIYGPSIWVLKRCLARKRDKDVPVLAVATSGKGQPLIFSKWEVKCITELLESSKGPETCLQALDSAATAAFILEAMPQHAVSHFSCHGSWNSSDPLNSSLSLYDEDLTLARLFQRVRLDNSRLVVLSACESGTGHSYNRVSEEYVGLPAGFIFAGARSVVGSLWSVLDPPTALLMVQLYQNLLAGSELSAALRDAQIWLMRLEKEAALKLLRQVVEVVDSKQHQYILGWVEKWGQSFGPQPFSKPYYWGAFQALGSPEAVFD